MLFIWLNFYLFLIRTPASPSGAEIDPCYDEIYRDAKA